MDLSCGLNPSTTLGPQADTVDCTDIASRRAGRRSLVQLPSQLMRKLRIGLCQIDLTVGALEANVERISRALDVCRRDGVELAVFPELAVTGYPPEDLLLRPGFVRANLQAIESVAQSARGICAVVGFVDRSEDLYNAAAVISDGRILSVYHKRLLPNYSVFDEARYFRAGTGQLDLVDVAGVKIGVSICEDAWSPDGPIQGYGRLGADLVVNLNASPYSLGKQLQRERMLSVRAADAAVALCYVNLVGGQDELVFDGGSMVFSADGDSVLKMGRFVEEICSVDLAIPDRFRKRLVDPRGSQRSVASGTDEVMAVTIHKAELPARQRTHHSASQSIVPFETQVDLVRDLDPDLLRDKTVCKMPKGPYEDPSEVYRALVLGTRDYVSKNGFPGVLIALSGGVDSALVASIAFDAVGPDRVTCVSMPSRYSSEGSVSDAELLCENFGLKFASVPIEDVHAPFLSTLGAALGDIRSIVEENLQSRIRGVIMMAMSNQTGAMVLTTGNKSEQATGYSTLYGDTAGGYAVIKDVSKLGVYQLCRWRNLEFGYDAIPDAILTKAPSAELRPDQRDDQSLPPYEVLDEIIEGYVEGDMTVLEMDHGSASVELVERVARLIDRSEYKRRQNPPGVRITEKAFGKDRRMPITNGFEL